MAIRAHLPKRVGWPCLVRSVLKRTPVQDFDSFSIMFYYIISITYQKSGDLFCLVHISGLSQCVRSRSSGPRNCTMHLNFVNCKNRWEKYQVFEVHSNSTTVIYLSFCFTRAAAVNTKDSSKAVAKSTKHIRL